MKGYVYDAPEVEAAVAELFDEQVAVLEELMLHTMARWQSVVEVFQANCCKEELVEIEAAQRRLDACAFFVERIANLRGRPIQIQTTAARNVDRHQ